MTHDLMTCMTYTCHKVMNYADSAIEY